MFFNFSLQNKSQATVGTKVLRRKKSGRELKEALIWICEDENGKVWKSLFHLHRLIGILRIWINAVPIQQNSYTVPKKPPNLKLITHIEREREREEGCGVGARDLFNETSARETIEAEDEAVRASKYSSRSSGVLHQVASGNRWGPRGGGSASGSVWLTIEDLEAEDWRQGRRLQRVESGKRIGAKEIMGGEGAAEGRAHNRVWGEG